MVSLWNVREYTVLQHENIYVGFKYKSVKRLDKLARMMRLLDKLPHIQGASM
jgi:hypothetical protein